MRSILTILLMVVALAVDAQEPMRIVGKVSDVRGEGLPGVVVYSADKPSAQVVTDGTGRYTISLTSPSSLVFRAMGYVSAEVAVTTSRTLDVTLEEESQNIGEVTVTSASGRARVAELQVGVRRIDVEEMGKLPVLFGERDIMKGIQLLPGVQSEGDGSSGYEVRGGTSSQNLILLDGATIYNAGHLMGIFSTFNDDALMNASLYKGQVPAQFGGGSSSVFDISTRVGGMERYSGSITAGLLSAKGYVEGPIVPARASFFASARRSYLDLFLKLTDDYKDDALNFYDINAKLAVRLGEGDMLSATFFKGQDNLGIDELMDMGWGNMAATMRWSHLFSPLSRMTLTAVASRYLSDISVEVLNTERSMGGAIRQVGLKASVDLSLGVNQLNFGGEGTLVRLCSAEWLMESYYEKEERPALEANVWLADEVSLGDHLGVSLGLRSSWFVVLGGAPYYTLDEGGGIVETLVYDRGKVVKSYMTLEPRLVLNLLFSEDSSLKIGYGRNSQNTHALRNMGMSLPFDRYTMTSNIIRPQVSNQVSAGYMHLLADGGYELSAEAYYKAISNVYDYRDGKSLMSEVEIERIIECGEGRAYGLELYGRRSVGRLNGWVSYTLSWAENKIAAINSGRWYTSSNDRRHNVSVVGMYELSKGWDVSATWVYSSGQALTAPSAKYEINGETYFYYAERNGYRAPAYHRLDLSVSHTRQRRLYSRQWAFGIYNLYNHYNPFMIMFEEDDSRLSGTRATQYSLFGILPSVSVTFKF